MQTLSSVRTSSARVPASLGLAARVLLAATWLLVAILKVTSAVDVLGEHDHGVISPLRDPLVSLPVAAAEILIAWTLFTAWWRKAALASFVLAALFGVVLAGLVLTGKPTGYCGCFGGWEPPLAAHFGMLLGMLLVSRTLVCEAADAR